MRIQNAGSPAALCASLLLLLSSCGGGSGGALAPNGALRGGAGGFAVNWSIPTSGEVQITHTGISENPFPWVAMSVGDTSINSKVVTVLQFDISNLNPAAADQVHLLVTTNPPAGSPFGDLGGVYVDHLQGEGGLVQEMHGGFTLDSAIAHLAVEQESYSIDVTTQVHADLAAGRTTSTFRFRTAIPTDTNEDYDQWRIVASSNNWPPSEPALQITEYQ